jgi:hypothetical protein
VVVFHNLPPLPEIHTKYAMRHLELQFSKERMKLQNVEKPWVSTGFRIPKVKVSGKVREHE